MKLGEREYIVQPVGANTPEPRVGLSVKAWGIPVAHELVTPQQAREFAGKLLAAADAAEGGTL